MKKLTFLLMVFPIQLFSQRLNFDELHSFAIHQYLMTDSSLHGKVVLLVNDDMPDTSINNTILINEFSKELAVRKKRINDALYVSHIYHKDGDFIVNVVKYRVIFRKKGLNMVNIYNGFSYYFSYDCSKGEFSFEKSVFNYYPSPSSPRP